MSQSREEAVGRRNGKEVARKMGENSWIDGWVDEVTTSKRIKQSWARGELVKR
jgi:hypothetical protein